MSQVAAIFAENEARIATTTADEKSSNNETKDEIVTSKTYKEVEDLGWNQNEDKALARLVKGMPNEDLWKLIRRFNKQMYCIKAIEDVLPGGLDLNIAHDEEFSPDKLRGNVERLYMTVMVGGMTLLKHVARLRSWNEKTRTATFCSFYYIAWYFDFLAPTLLCFAILFTLSPMARTFAFPSVPIALVNTVTGSLQNPRSGMLGSNDSITGAPEVHQGEAVEGEASNFVTGIATMVLSSTLGKKPEEKQDGVPRGKAEETIPDPLTLAAVTADVKSSATGQGGEGQHDEQTRYVEDAMWEKMRPMMHIMGNICDAWERFGNALSPTAPFPMYGARLRIAMIMATLIFPTRVINAHMVSKFSGFAIGLAFFGQPFITKAVHFLNSNFPAWPESLELRNTLLKGVPTNAQLTITLLRMHESKHAPLPPPPRTEDSNTEASSDPFTEDHKHRPDEIAAALNTTPSVVNAAIKPGEMAVLDENEKDYAVPKTTENTVAPPTAIRTYGGLLLSGAKVVTGAGVSLVLGADHIKAQTGSEVSRTRLGVVEAPETLKMLPKSGPVNFTCRYHGDEGMLSVHNDTQGPPTVSFTYAGPTASAEAAGRQKAREMLGLEEGENQNDDRLPGFGEHGEPGQAVFSIPIGDIKELRKLGGLGWKGKLIIGWALGRSIENSIELVDREGRKYLVTAIPLRDELFNRLASIGPQKWECW